MKATTVAKAENKPKIRMFVMLLPANVTKPRVRATEVKSIADPVVLSVSQTANSRSAVSSKWRWNLCMKWIVSSTAIPITMAPIIIVVCAIGAYTVHSSMFDVVMMLVFGVAGYFFKKLKYPLAPLVLALVLGDKAESSFRQAMLLSQGSLSIFWANPLVGSIAGLAMVLLLWPMVGALKARLRAREGAVAEGGAA